MHVLYVTGEYPPMTGGVGAYTQVLAHALVDLDLQVSVLTAAGAGAPREEAGVTVYPQVRRWGWRAMGQAAALAKQIQADWIHVQYQTAAFQMRPAINLAPALWKSQGLRVAWTYHDLRFPYLLPKIGDRLRQSVNLLPLRAAHVVITTDPSDRQLLARRRDDVLAIPIGSNIPAVVITAGERMARRQARGYAAQEAVIGYFGFLNRSKGGLTLIRTLHALGQSNFPARLLMIGERVGASDPTNYAYLQEVEALAHSLGVAEQIQWTGFLPDREVSLDLAACDVILLPFMDGASLRRGSLMAALAQGCAIVTTRMPADLAGPTELVDGRDLLCVAVDDAEAAAQAVERIARDPALAHSLGDHARLASRQFTWETIARQHKDLYLHNKNMA